MPLYEYKCENCERVVELSVPVEERDWPIGCWDPIGDSDGCDPQQKMYRLPSRPGIVLKGSGFHKTDYKDK